MTNNETYTCLPSEVCLSDSDNELLIPTPWSDESKNEKGKKDKGTDVMKDKVSQEYVCEEEVPLNNNIGKQSGDFLEIPNEAVEQGMDDNVPDKIDGVKGEQVPNHVVKKVKVLLGYRHILPDYLTNPTMKASKAYKTYHDLATGKKQPYLGLETLSEVALTEAEQLKLATKRSLIQTHSLHASGSGAHEGTGVISGVLDVPTYRFDDEEIPWKSSDEKDDDDEANIGKDKDVNDQDDDDNIDHDDDSEWTDSDNNGDEFVHPKFTTHDDEARQEAKVNEED
ncbi:hypothetical protein Tco_0766020, partial [Tanacetum coccineum]